MRHAQRVLVNGAQVTVGVTVEECDYCGTAGCCWQRHGEAHADVTAWRKFMANDENTWSPRG